MLGSNWGVELLILIHYVLIIELVWGWVGLEVQRGRKENGCGKNEKGAIVDKSGKTEGTLWLQKLKVNQ